MERIYEYKDANFFLHHTKSEHPNPASSTFSLQIHDKYELYYCMSGKGVFLVEGHPYDLFPGMVMILRPGEAHSLHISTEETYDRITLLFSHQAFDKSHDNLYLLEPFRNRSLGHDNCYYSDSIDPDFVLRCLTNMIRPDRDREEQRIAIASSLPAVLAHIRMAYSGGDPDSNKWGGIVGEVAAYINAHLSEDWTLDTLESDLHRNKDYMNRKFKEAMGSSIWEYTTHKRIIAARQDILEGDSIESVFEKSGFKDYSTFFRQYRKVVGVSPSDDAKSRRISV